MQFVSSARRLDYVIRPKVKHFSSLGISQGVHPSHLRVEFRGNREGVFDSASDTMKRTYGRVAKAVNELPEMRDKEPLTAESVQNEVEQYLLNHEDNGRLFYVVTDSSMVETQKPCSAPIADPTNPGATCGKPAIEGGDYCADCARELNLAPAVV